eukprot:TRINITY_DN30224_c0_g3_i1.p1 TRINITY_DN30224_c0_g3~~TRINITY_DN30224_c0_g3_i1.p1  ORF type:complete len:310 (+),score=79.07 TRINITY_DN30224_c0_g3_i1:52-981(+)
MDVFLEDAVTGDDHAVSVSEDATTAQLLDMANTTIQFPDDVTHEDIRLTIDGTDLDADQPLGSLPGVAEGCRIRVSLSGARFVSEDREAQMPLDRMPKWARSLKECIVAVIRCHGLCLETADPSDLRDADIMLAALQFESTRGRGYAQLYYAIDPLLREDRSFMLAAVSIIGRVLEVAPSWMCHDKEVVVAAVGADGDAMLYAGMEFRNDPEVVMAWMLSMGLPRYWSYDRPALFDDRDFMLRAVRRYPHALRWAGVDLTKDTDLVVAAMQGDTTALFYAHASLRWDKGFMQTLRLKGLKLPKDLPRPE